jgi:hypothetical protein
LKQHAPSSATLIGKSPCMNQLRQTIDRAAKANSRIMIVGPSGGGKELVARTLHAMSSRAEGPFVVINAAAITPERMEVELFGVELSDGETGRKPARWKKPMAARCLLTKSPTCRAKPRTGFCACWSIRPSSGQAARPKSVSMCASCRRPAQSGSRDR